MHIYCSFIILFILLISHNLTALNFPIVYTAINHNPTTSITISWITQLNEKMQEDTVYYREKTKKNKKKNWQSATGTHTSFTTEAHLVHHVTIHHLQPATVYEFQITGYSRQYTTATVPATPPIHFIVGGDAAHKGMQIFQKMCQTGARHRPHFVVIGGDLAYAFENKRSSEQPTLWLEWLETYTSTMTYDNRLIPLAVTLGNHDVPNGGFGNAAQEARSFFSLFPFMYPKGYNTISIPQWMTLLLLNSGHSSPIGGAQTDWLRHQLQKNHNTKNRFAVYHMPAYPGRGQVDTYTQQIRRYWTPLFDTYRLHIAFENHEHIYKRTMPITNGSVSSHGVVYMGGGAMGTLPRKKPDDFPYLIRAKNQSHFLFISIAHNERRVHAWTQKNELLDIIIQPYDTTPLD